MNDSLQGYQKKQKLLLQYYHAINALVKEKAAVGAKIKKANDRFEQLLEADADDAQLVLFENLDEFLTETVAA